jgi:hypothetical protein
MSNVNTEMNPHSNIASSTQINGVVRRRKTVLTTSASVCLLLTSMFVSRADETTNRVTSIRVPSASKVLKAQSGADGVIHLLFDAASGPQYVKSQDGGLTFSAPLAVVDVAAQKPGLKFSGADIAVGKDGRVHVAMANNAWKLKLPKDEWSLHYATLPAGAKAFSPVRNLNRQPSEGFSLAAGERGAVTACFLSGKLFAMVSRDGGETFASSAELNPTWNPCDCCTTAAAYGRDGNLALIYREETKNERDIYVVLWNQSRDTEPSRTRISRTPWKIEGCPMTYFTIAPTATGYVAAWPTKGQVYFARLDKGGAVLPPGEIRTPGTSGMRMGLLAVSADDGVSLVAWKNKEVLGWQLYDAKGQPQGNPDSTTSPGDGAAGVVLPNGKFVLFP